MFRALYSYNSTSNHYLTFQAGDEFTWLEKQNGGWLLVQNGFGEIGYVPENYLQKIENPALTEIIKSIDRAIQAIHYNASSTGQYTHQDRQKLKLLSQHREKVLKKTPKQEATPAPSSPISPTEPHSTGRRSSRRAAPPPPPCTSQLSSTIVLSNDSFSSSYPSLPTGDNTQASPCSSSVKTEKLNKSHKNNEEIILLNTPAAPKVPEQSTKSDQGTSQVKHLKDVDSGKQRCSNVDQSEQCINVIETEGLNNGLDDSYVVISKDNEQHKVSTTVGETNLQRTLPPVTPLIPSPSKNLPTSTANLHLSPSRFIKSPSVINFESISVPERMASDMVEQLREHTGLSYNKSCLAVEIVLGQVAAKLPQMASVMDKILITFSEDDTEDEEASYDGTMLQELLVKLTECKDDAQQRSWCLFEDQKTIMGYLEELLSILEKAKVSVCRKVIAANRYEYLHNLVEYYQMETRVNLRMELLKCFGAMCGFEASIISNLLYSILPLELVSEIRNKCDNTKLVAYVAIVLSMILSTGEPLPSSLSDHIDNQFINFLFDLIENPPNAEFEDEASNQIMVVILALNLHYSDYESNPIMSVLAVKGTVKVFTEKLLVLFNRGEDPVQMFDFQTNQQNSVMTFMTDLYRDKATSSLLYTNDAKVLIDIIIRQLTDLQPGDKVRTSCLALANLFVENSDYLENKHRESELCRCLHTILHEESNITADDKIIVSDILDQIQDLT